MGRVMRVYCWKYGTLKDTGRWATGNSFKECLQDFASTHVMFEPHDPDKDIIVNALSEHKAVGVKQFKITVYTQSGNDLHWVKWPA